AVSANGRFVAMITAARLVGADTNSRDDIYVLDRASGAVSLETAAVPPIRGSRPAISATGRFLVYEADVDTESPRVLMLRDRDTGAVRPLQRAGHTPNGPSRGASISAAGRYVAFSSSATNFVDGGDAGSAAEDVYVADVTSMSFTLVGPGHRRAESPT